MQSPAGMNAITYLLNIMEVHSWGLEKSIYQSNHLLVSSNASKLSDWVFEENTFRINTVGLVKWKAPIVLF